jgi:hypothetical protein
MKRLALVGIWIALGVVATVSSELLAQTPSKAAGLVFIDAGTNSRSSSLVFVKDPVSGGCWFGVDAKGQGLTSLAAAPADACSKR